jgi:hypothetical protein
MKTRNDAGESDTDPVQFQDVPDFQWPYRVAERIFERLTDLWGVIKDMAAAHLVRRAGLRWTLVFVVSAGLIYLVTLWVSFSYLRFPISPFGAWDLAEWLIETGSVVCGAVALYFFTAFLFAVVGVMLSISTHLTLSLGYLCWNVWNSHGRQSAWLKRYSVVMIFGITMALALATFVDGTYRFWDRPFTAFRWAKFAFVGACAWAALFCHLMRDNATSRGTPRRIVIWTVASAIGLAILRTAWRTKTERSISYGRKSHGVPKTPAPG